MDVAARAKEYQPMRAALGRSTMRSVQSRDVDMSHRPSELQARSVIRLEWPTNERTSLHHGGGGCGGGGGGGGGERSKADKAWS